MFIGHSVNFCMLKFFNKRLKQKFVGKSNVYETSSQYSSFYTQNFWFESLSYMDVIIGDNLNIVCSGSSYRISTQHLISPTKCD